VVGAVIRAASPDSFIYCRDGGALPSAADFWNADPEIQIVTVSHKVGHIDGDRSYTILDRDWDNMVYYGGIGCYPAVFKSAGNEGHEKREVTSPGKGLNVITVGAYNDDNDTIWGESSSLDPYTGNDKPEIVAPGTNIKAGGLGPESGTSLAAPHAAAFAADMISNKRYLRGKPYLLKAKMLAAATDWIKGGYDKVGLGGIDFRYGGWYGVDSWYYGPNFLWDWYDRADGRKDGWVSKQIYIGTTDRAKVVLSWLTRGDYTYAHRKDAHPIGIDLDLYVYDPYGRLVGYSASWDNSYEHVLIEPLSTGYYTIKIHRYANRDTGNDLAMGVSVNRYNY
jgi:hypothetical protein